MSIPPRRLAIGLSVLASVIIVGTVLAAIDQAYGFSDARHIHVAPFAHPFLGVAIGAVLLGIAGRVALLRRGARIAVQVVAGVVAAAATLLGLLSLQLSGVFGAKSSPTIVATSDDVKLLSYRKGGFLGSDSIVLRLRSNDGLTSIEGVQDLGCFAVEESGAGPEWQFDRAVLTGPGSATLYTKDGTSYQATFEPGGVRPGQAVDRCTDAPDIWND